MLHPEVKHYIDKSVLCWLATSHNNQPNVSPKEMFTYYEDRLIIANIASPQSIVNITNNTAVCVSFIDILEQKGYKILGEASIITMDSPQFALRHNVLKKMAGEKFNIPSIIEVIPTKIDPIIAPSYQFYPDTTETEVMIANAKQQYLLE